MRSATRSLRISCAGALAIFAITSPRHWQEPNCNAVSRWSFLAAANRASAETPTRMLPATIAVSFRTGFEENCGQAPADARFLSRGSDCDLMLTRKGAVFSLNTRKLTGASGRETVKMEYGGITSVPRLTGVNLLQAKSSYFKGNDAGGWVSGATSYSAVRYTDVYPGIDQVFYRNGSQIEYDFVVRPGSNPQVIRLHFYGQTGLRLDSNGDLVLKTPAGEIRHKSPRAYQDINGERLDVSARFVVVNDADVCFELGVYASSQTLVIDPVLEYSTYIGGAGRDEGNAIAVDPMGSIYVTGFTDSPDRLTGMPAGVRPAGSTSNSFLIKLSSDGQTLLYSVHFSDCEARGLAVDSAGNAYLTGQADPGFAVTSGAFQTNLAGDGDAFIAKLDSAGSLVYSTLVGGTGDDRGLDVSVDASGNAYICGETHSANFPTTSRAFQRAHGGGAFDAFVTKLSPDGTELVYSTYLGALKDDRGQGIAVDSAGTVYVTGFTNSKTFPATPGSYEGSELEYFTTKLSADGSTLIYSIFGLGGSDIAIDAEGNAYLTGTTSSKKLGTLGKPFQRYRQGKLDAFVAKLNSAGTDIVYATYLGGGDNDYGSAIGIDSEGNAYVAGMTESRDFPAAGSVQSDYGGFGDAFVTALNTEGSSLIYSTLLGGGDTDLGEAIAVFPSGTVCAVGSTRSIGFPTASPLQANKGSGNEFDAFVVKIEATTPVPVIDSARWTDGRLYIFGRDFDFDAKILIDGDKVSTQSDVSDSTSILFSRAARSRIAPGQTVTLQVRNSTGKTSNEIAFTRPE